MFEHPWKTSMANLIEKVGGNNAGQETMDESANTKNHDTIQGSHSVCDTVYTAWLQWRVSL